MTDETVMNPPRRQKSSLLAADERTRKRNASEARFQLWGKLAVAFGVLALLGLLLSIGLNGASSFRQTYIELPVYLDPAKLDKDGSGDIEAIKKVTTFGYKPLILKALEESLATAGINTDDLSSKELKAMISAEAPAVLRNLVITHPDQIGERVNFSLLASGRIDGYFKGRVTMESAALDRNVSPAQLVLADAMRDAGLLETKFNWAFFTAPDASDTRPEAAGLGVAILGSLYMMLVVLGLSLPLGVAAAIYLEEFAAKNRFTDLIEVNISNLAAVPSIVFGILGLSIFINWAGLPQSAPIVGGLVLTLMTLPRIIIPARAALTSVPPSIREAALGVGASKMQSVFHHVLPLAMPGILTGVIIGLAQALGETAPLLLIGMVAFVREFPAAPPDGLLDAASALPVQVYNWTTRGDPAFFERASGAIIVLLLFLFTMNIAAVILRRRFERRW